MICREASLLCCGRELTAFGLAKGAAREYTAGMTMLRDMFLAGAMFAVAAPAMAETEWMTDLPAAQQRAAAENKLVLVDFTGSDWCGWCVRLHKDVFETEGFETYVADKFVMMEVDVPQNPNFDKELRARNEELCSRYGIDGFPTLMVMTPEGVVTGGFVGGRPDLPAVEQPLEAARANAEAYAAAQKLEGVEKAKALFAVYQALPEELQPTSAAIQKEIMALDPEDSTGMKEIIATREQKTAMMAELNEAHGEPAAMMTILEKYLAEALPGNRGGILNIKARVMLTTADNLEDIAAAKEMALQAIECEPETAAENRAGVEKTFADPEALLERARHYRERRAQQKKK